MQNNEYIGSNSIAYFIFQVEVMKRHKWKYKDVISSDFFMFNNSRHKNSKAKEKSENITILYLTITIIY